MRGGILDCRCARRSARRQVGTKGWSYSDRTKGWALELNSTALAHHAQFAELDAHNFGAGRYERSGERTTWRNGYRDRTLDTRLGALPLRIPSLRGGNPEA